MGEWQPEEDKDEERIGRAIMRREELRNMAMSLTMRLIDVKVDKPATMGWNIALEMQKKLDKETPIPGME